MDKTAFQKKNIEDAHRRVGGSEGTLHNIDEKRVSHAKKHAVAKKMKPIGEDMHKTFKKLGKAVGKFKKYKNVDPNKPAF